MSAGERGFLDHAGYSVGATPIAGKGFVGLVDFVGYPVGTVASGDVTVPVSGVEAIGLLGQVTVETGAEATPVEVHVGGRGTLRHMPPIEIPWIDVKVKCTGVLAHGRLGYAIGRAARHTAVEVVCVRARARIGNALVATGKGRSTLAVGVSSAAMLGSAEVRTNRAAHIDDIRLRRRREEEEVLAALLAA